MTHEEIQTLAALNAISAASPEEVLELRRHLETCPECRTAASVLDETAALIAFAADSVAPPPRIRDALLHEVRRDVRETPASPRSWPWWAAAAAVLLVLWGTTALQLRSARTEQRRLRDEVARLKTDRQKLSQAIAAVSGPGTRTIELTGQAVAPGASARVFLDPAARRAFVFFQGLPAHPSDKNYQLWIIRADRAAPQSAGVFNVDAGGNASLVVQNLPVDTEIKALAVTLEPKGGVASPTGKKYLVGTNAG